MPSYVWDGETLPVPVEDIVDSVYGLRVRLVDDLGTAPGAPDTVGTLSGLLLTGPGEIWVNKEEAGLWPGRRRFTIGHELGHWELHRTDKQSLYCRTASIEESDQPASAPRPAVPIAEEEANSFAAALLMPADFFVNEYERLNGDTTALCDRFKCSAKAVGHRIHALIPDHSQSVR
ncbi:MAG: ImmA/IrrE family metallo-endopeptidase [Nitrospirae bacterium]|nr:ImmA/IrrE family metallo-endopeptidase [Fimbriimonadaceae bacterium]